MLGGGGDALDELHLAEPGWEWDSVLKSSEVVGEEARFLLADRMEMHFQPSAFYMIVKLRLLPVRRGPAGRHEPVWDGEVGQRLQLGRLEGGRGLVHLAG